VVFPTKINKGNRFLSNLTALRIFLAVCIFSLPILSTSCISPEEVVIEEEVRVLIIEGFLTTEQKKHQIRLTRTAIYGDVFTGQVQAERFAKVVLRDTEGTVFEFNEVSTTVPLWRSPPGSPPPPYNLFGGYSQVFRGFYELDHNCQIEVGKTYTLLITTNDGEEYMSLPQRVTEAPKIDELSIKFRPPLSSPLSASSVFEGGVDIYASFLDNPTETNFYLWRNEGILNLNTNPAACCASCWVPEIPDRGIYIHSDQFTNGNVNKVLTAFIENDGRRFTGNYWAKIKQYTIDQATFQYFSLLVNQLSISGSIFDPPPATIRGNLIHIADNPNRTIGHFWIADVSIDSIMIPGRDFQDVLIIGQFNHDCREYFRRPPFDPRQVHTVSPPFAGSIGHEDHFRSAPTDGPTFP
jgi:hypothetical protein